MTRDKKGRRQKAASHASIEAELARLKALDLKALRAEWREHFETDPPRLSSRNLLCRFIAWQMQANALGGLDKKTERALERIAERLERDGDYEPVVRRDLAPGVELAREWKGTIHKVTVLADGFRYMGKRYGSLSDIARTITGTRWSGPRFFGLEQKGEPQPQKRASSSTTTPTVSP